MTVELSDQIALRGTDRVPAEPERITCGPLTLLLAGGEIRSLCAAGIELIRHMYVSVRDKDWNTVEPEITAVERHVQDSQVRLRINARNRAGMIDFIWQATIELTADGVLSYEMSGQADANFDYCRIGFCLLFGESSGSGRPYRATTPDGVCRGTLPVLIEPQRKIDGIEQPLFPACTRFELDLPQGTIRTEFEGDLFEMEDQRNWTDASFKMYCTPIALGYPHHALAGQRFRQRIVVSTGIRGPGRTLDGGRSVTLDLAGHPQLPRPALGIGQSSALDRPMTHTEASLIATLRPDHLRVDLHLGSDRWTSMLARAISDARTIGCALELAVHVGSGADDGADGACALRQLGAQLSSAAVSRVLVLDADNHGTATTPAALVSRVRKTLREAGTTSAVGGGTDGDFAELNRDRPDVAGSAFVAYAMNPQVHAFDEMSLMQTLPTQASTVITARSFCGDTPIVVSPVTLRPRFNPAAMTFTETDAAADPTELPPSVDRRQMSQFAAAWALGSIASLISAGANAVTMFETIGWRGVLERITGELDPSPFRSTPGMLFPLFHVWRDIAEDVTNGPCTPVLDPTAGLAALAMPVTGGRRIVIANLHSEPQQITLLSLPGEQARIRILDVDTAAQAAHRPADFRERWHPLQPIDGRATILLRAYAYARVDLPDDPMTPPQAAAGQAGPT